MVSTKLADRPFNLQVRRSFNTLEMRIENFTYKELGTVVDGGVRLVFALAAAQKRV